jgi:hypothetical protein
LNELLIVNWNLVRCAHNWNEFVREIIYLAPSFQELKIAMQCQGMQINGVVREEERLLLEKLIAKASS